MRDLWLVAAGAADLQSLADQLLAPFVTLGTLTGTGAVLGAVFGKIEAVNAGMSEPDADSHVQAMYNEGLVAAGSIAFWPVAFLIADLVT